MEKEERNKLLKSIQVKQMSVLHEGKVVKLIRWQSSSAEYAELARFDTEAELLEWYKEHGELLEMIGKGVSKDVRTPKGEGAS